MGTTCFLRSLLLVHKKGMFFSCIATWTDKLPTYKTHATGPPSWFSPHLAVYMSIPERDVRQRRWQRTGHYNYYHKKSYWRLPNPSTTQSTKGFFEGWRVSLFYAGSGWFVNIHVDSPCFWGAGWTKHPKKGLKENDGWWIHPPFMGAWTSHNPELGWYWPRTTKNTPRNIAPEKMMEDYFHGHLPLSGSLVSK